MSGTLTGAAGAEAIGLYARLGAAGARFDASLVGRAVRSRRGRLRLAGALGACRRATRTPRPACSGPRRAARRQARTCRARAASKSPGRPARPAEGGRDG